MNPISCCFSLFHRDMIATGCEDKCVRVFYVAASTDLPLKIFSGKNHASLIDKTKYKSWVLKRLFNWLTGWLKVKLHLQWLVKLS